MTLLDLALWNQPRPGQPLFEDPAWLSELRRTVSYQSKFLLIGVFNQLKKMVWTRCDISLNNFEPGAEEIAQKRMKIEGLSSKG